MKIKGTEVQVGDMILLIEKYSPEYSGHTYKDERQHLYFVVGLFEDNGFKAIQVKVKRLPNPKFEKLVKFRDVFTKGFRNMFRSNFGFFGMGWYSEQQIKLIKVLK